MTHIRTFLLFPFLASAQVHGIIRDESNGDPVAYANVYADDRHWVSADENGTFDIDATPDDTLRVTAVGYRKTFVSAKKAADIRLQAETIGLQGVTVVKPRNILNNAIGGYRRKDLDLTYSISGLPWMVARYFAPDAKVEQTPFLKSIVVATKSPVKDAKFAVHFLAVGPDGSPGEELLSSPAIGIAKKGAHDTRIDLQNLHVRLPETGFFVGLEWLVLPGNQGKEKFVDSKGVERVGVYYAPYFSTTRAERNTSWGYTKMKTWGPFQKVAPEKVAKYYDDFKKATGKEAPPFDYRHNEFAMEIELTD